MKVWLGIMFELKFMPGNIEGLDLIGLSLLLLGDSNIFSAANVILAFAPLST